MASAPSSRLAWVDYSKGICIVLVVMMHSATSYNVVAPGWSWLHNVVEWALPFRMPDFFLLSGLFLSRTINAPLRDYLDKKVLHFIYFYLLWLAIQMPIVEANLLLDDPAAFAGQFALALVDPYQTMWFVHMLAIFFAFTRLVRKAPAALVFAAAALLQTLYHMDVLETGWSVIDRFADRYLYFFTGYAAAPLLFKFAEACGKRVIVTLPLLILWGVGNWLAVQAHIHEAPVTSILMGLVGAAAVVATGAMLSRTRIGDPIRYAGANSIVVYLTFVIPMKAAHKFFYLTGVIPDIGTVAAISTVFAVATPLLFHHCIKDTPLNFLYRRPRMFGGAHRDAPQPAGVAHAGARGAEPRQEPPSRLQEEGSF